MNALNEKPVVSFFLMWLYFKLSATFCIIKSRKKALHFEDGFPKSPCVSQKDINLFTWSQQNLFHFTITIYRDIFFYKCFTRCAFENVLE